MSAREKALREALESVARIARDARGAADAHGVTTRLEQGLRIALLQVDSRATRALAAEPEGEVVMGWQPFETAPKDGSEIIVYRPDAGVLTALFCLPDPEDEYKEGRDEIWFTARGEDIDDDPPTHWMPLPVGPDCSEPEGETVETLIIRGDQRVVAYTLRDGSRGATTFKSWAARNGDRNFRLRLIPTEADDG